MSRSDFLSFFDGYDDDVEEEVSQRQSGNDKRVLIIGRDGEFLAGAIANALKQKGFEASTCKPTVTDVSRSGENIHLYLMIVEYISELSELLVYLKDQIYDNHIYLTVICQKSDENEICSLIPRDEITAFFHRPINTKEISVSISEIYEKSQGEGKKKSILIIDDDPVFLRKTQNLLRKNYKTYIAGSGTAAVMVLTKHPADLVLLDYDMPITDGPTVYRMIKAESALKDIPIMFLTGKRDVESVKRACELRPEKYLTKSIPAAELLSTISEFFVTSQAKAAR